MPLLKLELNAIWHSAATDIASTMQAAVLQVTSSQVLHVWECAFTASLLLLNADSTPQGIYLILLILNDRDADSVCQAYSHDMPAYSSCH
jgi:hypothetical protein